MKMFILLISVNFALLLNYCLAGISRFSSCNVLLANEEKSKFCSFCDSPSFAKECSAQCSSVCSSDSIPKGPKLRTTAKPRKAAKQNDVSEVCDGIHPCVELAAANRRFEQCCTQISLSSTCLPYCRYNVTQSELAMSIMRGECSVNTLQFYLQCASNNKDSTPCCEAAKVLGGNRSVCKVLCNPKDPDFPTSRMEAQKLTPCIGQFRTIEKCHWASIDKNDVNDI